MKLLNLTNSELKAEVSDEDHLILMLLYKWHLRKDGYAQSTSTHEYLHLIVARRMGLIGEIDHKDRTPLNCMRDNLRVATRSQNNANSERVNLSGYRGVTWNDRAKKYRAMIKEGKKQKHIGYFVSPIDAAKAYDANAKRIYGEFARLNFA